MEKRKLTTLRAVLLRYLLLCGGGCLLIILVWWGIFMQLIRVGFVLPAVASAQACAEARESVAAMTAETFDSSAISDLCRWAVVQDDKVLYTNMTDRQLKIALHDYHGGSGNLGLTQYQYSVKMSDGSYCLLHYDYAVPYADPELRRTLPDFQTLYLLLLAALLAVWAGLMTHRTVRAFSAETYRITQAVQAVADQTPEKINPADARIREFSAVLQSMQTMGRALTDSLQTRWRLEQQRTEQIAALTHDLKTPLTIIQGNAELLAEDTPDTTQKAELDAILRGTQRAQQYLAALRTVGTPPAAKTRLQSHALAAQIAKTAAALCAPAGLVFRLTETWQGGLYAAENDLLRAAENLLDNAVRFTPRGGTVTVCIAQTDGAFLLRVADTGPGFSAEALAKAGEMFFTDSARSGGEHQGLGLYSVRRIAEAHGGTLRLFNAGGGCAELRLPICE